jgi:hypothetical protein
MRQAASYLKRATIGLTALLVATLLTAAEKSSGRQRLAPAKQSGSSSNRVSSLATGSKTKTSPAKGSNLPTELSNGGSGNIPWDYTQYIATNYSNFGQILGQWSQNDSPYRNTLDGYVVFQGGGDVENGDLIFWSAYDRQVLGRFTVVEVGTYDLSSGYGVIIDDPDIPGDQGGVDDEELLVSWRAENGNIYAASWSGSSPVINSGVGRLGRFNIVVNESEPIFISESAPTINGVQMALTNFLIAVTGLLSGQTYAVQTTTNLVAGTWTNETSFVATQSSMTLTNSAGNTTQKFYRIAR